MSARTGVAQVSLLILGLFMMLLGAWIPTLLRMFPVVLTYLSFLVGMTYWLGIGILIFGAFVTVLAAYLPTPRRLGP